MQRRHLFHSIVVASALCLWVTQVAAAQPAESPRRLPAEKQKPQDAVLQEQIERERIAPPPAKGKGKGKLLRASPEPPPDVRAEQQAEALARDAGPPPKKARPESLIQKIESRPGGREKADAAKRGLPPKARGRDSASAFMGRMADGVLAFFIPSATAGETLTIDLTPQVDSYGRHSSLRTSNPNAYAYFYGGYISSSYPSNDSVRIHPTNVAQLGHSTSNPYARLHVNIPTAGWYIMNANAYVYGSDNVSVRHYESGSYAVLEDLPRQAGWSDYPSLQYLEAGYHNFYWVFPRGATISRLSVDSYP